MTNNSTSDGAEIKRDRQNTPTQNSDIFTAQQLVKPCKIQISKQFLYAVIINNHCRAPNLISMARTFAAMLSLSHRSFELFIIRQYNILFSSVQYPNDNFINITASCLWFLFKFK